MSDPNPAQRFVEAIPHAKALGMQLESIGEGKAVMSMPYDARFIGDPATGVISGGAVSVGAPSVSGTGMSLLASTCSSQLSPGGVCTLTVRCNPAAPGTQMGALVVPTGAGVKSVALTCQAQAAQLSYRENRPVQLSEVAG